MDIEKIKNLFSTYIVSVLNKEGFEKYFVNVLKTQYADFNGRATRSQYWYFAMFYFFIALILSVIDTIIFGGMALGGLLALATLVPNIAISIRRIHDLGKPWFWFLIAFVPFIGGIALLVWFCMPGEANDNQWGKASN